ncbi:HindVP family restriction endonuclease [Spirulina major CS-329]|uniref:HindVP family restriction endonuclease n=1 Tax=Spirulina TaxID=1154 RepID=UPI0023302DC2|nr:MULTISPECIES: HindVP family restriction endonuclease [Spirulina]MDB9496507.1 HindVP family restriction endonuclease [Spirulina subsalsa CS-330]MDB9502022.1 HindVP family restriction endonuclease [Spirulina major CS-329]
MTMADNTIPRLFGLRSSNRDFSDPKTWGKNQFNSSFPASLCCYLYSQNHNANYLVIQDSQLKHEEISIAELFRIHPLDHEIYFAFESTYTPFQQFIVGSLPRTDLVIQKKSNGKCLIALEIKLTALPDHTTCHLQESEYGSEIVIRPDTIVYLACSIAKALGSRLNSIFPDELAISDWSDPHQVLQEIYAIKKNIQLILHALHDCQSPFLLQPIWKTMGKSPVLSENCLDVFVWSDASFTYFINEIANQDFSNATRITRQTRTLIWLFKMLLEIKKQGRFNPTKIINDLSYNTKNDKAFSASGSITNKFMACQRQKKPIIKKTEIKNIILGGGQNLLSPERRFDAIIVNSPELF